MGRGNSGLFGGTKGAGSSNITNNATSSSVHKAFDAKKLSYDDSRAKIETYILNINHEKGGSKAKFFIDTLGYSPQNPKQFFDNLAMALDNKVPIQETKTKYGLVYNFHEKIRGVNGNVEFANIVAAIQKDNGKTTFRIITVYPGGKEN